MTEWAAFDAEINATMLYDEEPADQVYYQALAAGEIMLDANALAPKAQKSLNSPKKKKNFMRFLNLY